MKKIMLVIAGLLVSISAWSKVDWPLGCSEPVWDANKCSAFIKSFQADPYKYILNSAGTLTPATVFIKASLTQGAKLSEKQWAIIETEMQIAGYTAALQDDPRTVQYVIPPAKIPATDTAFSGCLFLREYVLSQSKQTCQDLLAPLAKLYYLSMRDYHNLCDDDEPSDCAHLK